MGIFLYYDRAVDSTILPSLNSIAEQQAHPTHTNEDAITHLLDYSSTNTNAIFKFKSSDMVLHIDSDAPYLSEPRAHIRTAGYWYLRYLPDDPKNIHTSNHHKIYQYTQNVE